MALDLTPQNVREALKIATLSSPFIQFHIPKYEDGATNTGLEYGLFALVEQNSKKSYFFGGFLKSHIVLYVLF